MDKKLYGVGINDADYVVRPNGKIDAAYSRWSCMLFRCYSEKYHAKQPTYADCLVCDEWLIFSNFKRWFDENYVEGYQLDKDILFKGNKVYSPETCCFVPKEINCILEASNKSRGDTPVGVFRRGNSFLSYSKVNGKRVYFGSYKTAEEAFVVKKTQKKKN